MGVVMAHKLNLSEAKVKYAWLNHCDELNKSGIQVDKVPRWQRRQQMRLSKYERFVNLLKKRGGHIEQKQPKKKGAQNVQSELTQT